MGQCIVGDVILVVASNEMIGEFVEGASGYSAEMNIVFIGVSTIAFCQVLGC